MKLQKTGQSGSSNGGNSGQEGRETARRPDFVPWYKRIRWIGVFILLLIVGVFVLWYYMSSAWIITTGHVVYPETTIESQARGRVDQIFVSEGTAVSKGDTVIQLRNETVQSTLDELRHLHQERQEQYRRAKRRKKRYERLFMANAVTRQEFEEVKSELQQARSRYLQSQASLEGARARNRQLWIRAPDSGVLSRISAERGDWVEPGEPLGVIRTHEGPWVRAYVHGRDLTDLAQGEEAVITIAGTDRTLNGTVNLQRDALEGPPVGPERILDPTRINQFVIGVYVELTQPIPPLRDDMPVEVKIARNPSSIWKYLTAFSAGPDTITEKKTQPSTPNRRPAENKTKKTATRVISSDTHDSNNPNPDSEPKGYVLQDTRPSFASNTKSTQSDTKTHSSRPKTHSNHQISDSPNIITYSELDHLENLTMFYTIQVESFTYRKKSKKLAEKLQKQEIPATIRSKRIQGQTWYRVRIGIFRSRTDAKTYAQRLKTNQKINQFWISKVTIPD